jgi:glycosyltransferase involved in cell wall biosynthesis
MKIGIAVHGRFEAFDLARELVRRGHQVGLLTNYPGWTVERFGVPRECVRSFWPHGVLTRALGRFGQPALRACEPQLHMLFGRWASATLRREAWDVVYAFSGVAEESLRADALRRCLRMVVRASTHIRTQDRLLGEEEVRTGIAQDRPSRWMIAREEREYALADAIRVLSTFAYDAFVAEGISASKLRLIVSGVETGAFRASKTDLELRRQRVTAGAPLRVLNVGTFSFRKGVWDTAAVIDAVDPLRFEFRFVGTVADEAARLAAKLHDRATFIARVPQSELNREYAWGDVFMLPTIEDGFPAVLGQAAAAGLPVLTTPNGAGADLVRDGQTGWILPIRSPRAFADQLRWADTHRPQLAEILQATQLCKPVRDSASVAQDFEKVCAEYLGPRVAACV